MFNVQRFNDKLTNNIVSFEQMGPGRFYSILYKGNNFCDLLFLFMNSKPLLDLKMVYSKRKEFAPKGKQIFFF